MAGKHSDNLSAVHSWGDVLCRRFITSRSIHAGQNFNQLTLRASLPNKHPDYSYSALRSSLLTQKHRLVVGEVLSPDFVSLDFFRRGGVASVSLVSIVIQFENVSVLLS